MSEPHRRPGDPYDVGFAKPPPHTQFKKGRSGNPNGRPRKKPDLYTELRSVLDKPMTVIIDGEPKSGTVQQALLLRLREEILQGEIWAGKLLEKLIDAIPDSDEDYGHIDQQVGLFRAKELLRLMHEESLSEKANQNQEPTEDGNGG